MAKGIVKDEVLGRGSFQYPLACPPKLHAKEGGVVWGQRGAWFDLSLTAYLGTGPIYAVRIRCHHKTRQNSNPRRPSTQNSIKKGFHISPLTSLKKFQRGVVPDFPLTKYLTK